jgi:hypothetical protein
MSHEAFSDNATMYMAKPGRPQEAGKMVRRKIAS